jgi:hypothetical protein
MLTAKLDRLLEPKRHALWFGTMVLVPLATAGGLLVSGCSAERISDQEQVPAAAEVGSNIFKQVGLAMENYSQSTSVFLTPAAPAQGESTRADRTSAAASAAESARRIVYDARIELVVESLAATEQTLVKLLGENHGFVSESDQSALTSSQRKAMWRVRVPVDRFDNFVSAVSRLGEVRVQHVGSQDVTEEFVDIEARIRNKQEEEKRLIKHLNETTGKLEEILAVERELSRVRGEVEQTQGRLRFLSNRTALSTITIEALERKDYKPPVVASFPTQLGRTFNRSVEAVVEFGKAVLLFVAAVVPWLPVIVIALFVGLGIARLIRNASRPAQLVAAGPGPAQVSG